MGCPRLPLSASFQTATIGRAPALVSNRRAIRNFNLSGLPGRSARSRDVASM
jgi:hypothetical protein